MWELGFHFFVPPLADEEMNLKTNSTVLLFYEMPEFLLVLVERALWGQMFGRGGSFSLEQSIPMFHN